MVLKRQKVKNKSKSIFSSSDQAGDKKNTQHHIRG